MWFVFSWLLHAPVCNCTCYWQTLMSRALLSCTTLACAVLARLSLYCSSISHCPWRSNKHREEGKLLLKAWLASRRITAQTIMKPITIIRVNGGCCGLEIEKRRRERERDTAQGWERWTLITGVKSHWEGKSCSGIGKTVTVTAVLQSGAGTGRGNGCVAVRDYSIAMKWGDTVGNTGAES